MCDCPEACLTPQLTIDGHSEDCGTCSVCLKVKSDADRARKFYWARKAKGRN